MLSCRAAAEAWEAAFVELARTQLSVMAASAGLRLSFSSERSVADELARESYADVSTVRTRSHLPPHVPPHPLYLLCTSTHPHLAYSTSAIRKIEQERSGCAEKQHVHHALVKCLSMSVHP